MRSKSRDVFDAIISYINAYYDVHGQPPEGRQIAGSTGISRATVTRYLAAMAASGEIEYDAYRRPVTAKMSTKGDSGSFIPIVGAIPCGPPVIAEQYIEGYVRLPESLTGSGEFFLLRAKGESMTGAGIEPGDLVLIRRQSYADPGRIVAALVSDSDATLKRYYPEPDKRRVRLHPENPTMDDMYYDECVVMGVAVKVIKDLA